jgi:hypothetical protein
VYDVHRSWPLLRAQENSQVLVQKYVVGSLQTTPSLWEMENLRFNDELHDIARLTIQLDHRHVVGSWRCGCFLPNFVIQISRFLQSTPLPFRPYKVEQWSCY